MSRSVVYYTGKEDTDAVGDRGNGDGRGGMVSGEIERTPRDRILTVRSSSFSLRPNLSSSSDEGHDGPFTVSASSAMCRCTASHLRTRRPNSARATSPLQLCACCRAAGWEFNCCEPTVWQKFCELCRSFVWGVARIDRLELEGEGLVSL